MLISQLPGFVSPSPGGITCLVDQSDLCCSTMLVEEIRITVVTNPETVLLTFLCSGLQPNATGRPYTIPAIRLPNGEGIAQDSNKIAAILDEIQPSQPLEPANPVTAQAEAVTAKTFAALAPLTLSTMPALMNPVSAESWTAKHEARLGGMSLASLRSSPAATKAWGNAGDGLGQLKVLLGEVANGPFLLGEKPCFADFVIVGAMITLSVADKEVFGRVMDWDESIRRLFEECREWMERVD